MYPQVSFTKKARVAFGDEESGGSEKDDQRAEVTFEDESEVLEKDDQNDQNDQNPFIALNWHDWLETILKVSEKTTHL